MRKTDLIHINKKLINVYIIVTMFYIQILKSLISYRLRFDRYWSLTTNVFLNWQYSELDFSTRPIIVVLCCKH
jgi:hypothetical protein